MVKNRVHLDLIPTEGGLETEIRRLERLGARRVRYVENDPDESHWIMADPEGNEFCCFAAAMGTPAAEAGGMIAAGAVSDSDDRTGGAVGCPPRSQ